MPIGASTKRSRFAWLAIRGKLYGCKATVDMFHLKQEDVCALPAGGQIIFT